MTTAQKILKETRSTNKREQLAKAQAKYIYDANDVLAARMDDGWSTMSIYEFEDGSKIRVNGAGIHAE
jgi:hypothetical protein